MKYKTVENQLQYENRRDYEMKSLGMIPVFLLA